jgi:hypothetical protein
MKEKYKLSKHEAVIEDYGHHENLVDSVREAYADVEPQASHWVYEDYEPCYTFTTPRWFTDGIALRCAFDAIDGAGSFDAEEVTPVTRGLQQRIGYIRVAVGRWHNPLLYIETDHPSEVIDRVSPVAADVQEVDHDKVGVATRYKNHASVGPHSQCDRDVPVVPWNKEAEPKEHKDVVVALFS